LFYFPVTLFININSQRIEQNIVNKILFIV